MAFIRKKTIKSYTYFYLVENHRINGKVKQKTISSLRRHPTVVAALAEFAQSAQRYRQYAASMARRADQPKGWREWRNVEEHKALALKYTQRAEELERQVETLKQYQEL